MIRIQSQQKSTHSDKEYAHLTTLFIIICHDSHSVPSSDQTLCYLYPFGSQRRLYSTFHQKFYFKIRREHKKIPMSAAPMSR